MRKHWLLLALTGVLSVPAMASEEAIVLPQAEVVSTEVMNGISGGLIVANGFDLSAGPIVSIGDFFQFPSPFFVSDDFYTELEVVELTEVLANSAVDLVEVGATSFDDLLGGAGDLVGGFLGSFLGGGIPTIPFI